MTVIAFPTLVHARRLQWVRGVHSLIYVTLALSTFVVVFAGATGAHGAWLWVALGLLALEVVVFVGNGLECPLSGLAVKLGAERGGAFETFLPERLARHTFVFFGALLGVGLSMLAARWLGWVAFGLVAAFVLVVVPVIVVLLNRRRFERRVSDEMRALVLVPHDASPASRELELPAPVARYRAIAVGDRAPVRTLRLTHGGTFRMSPRDEARPIRGTQLFTSGPPGFVWTGRVRIGPGLWVDVRDMSVSGAGSMRVFVDDTIRIADARGPELDQGAAVRLLAEMPWYPTALFDSRTVRWTAIDATRARATLRLGVEEVSGTFEFGPDGLPVRMTALRFSDRGALTPWSGVYRDWRTVSGMRVPFEAEVSWQLESGPFTYAHWRVDSMVYDEAQSPDAETAIAFG